MLDDTSTIVIRATVPAICQIQSAETEGLITYWCNSSHRLILVLERSSTIRVEGPISRTFEGDRIDELFYRPGLYSVSFEGPVSSLSLGPFVE